MSKRKAKSVRGENVDFDLLETKQKMEDNKPKAAEVKQREDFVHTKRRSRGQRAVMQKLRERRQSDKKKTDTTSKKTSQKTSSGKTESTKTDTKRKKKTTRKIVKD